MTSHVIVPELDRMAAEAVRLSRREDQERKMRAEGVDTARSGRPLCTAGSSWATLALALLCDSVRVLYRVSFGKATVLAFRVTPSSFVDLRGARSAFCPTAIWESKSTSLAGNKC